MTLYRYLVSSLHLARELNEKFAKLSVAFNQKVCSNIDRPLLFRLHCSNALLYYGFSTVLQDTRLMKLILRYVT
jgi:hypothetical protein